MNHTSLSDSTVSLHTHKEGTARQLLCMWPYCFGTARDCAKRTAYQRGSQCLVSVVTPYLPMLAWASSCGTFLMPSVHTTTCCKLKHSKSRHVSVVFSLCPLLMGSRPRLLSAAFRSSLQLLSQHWTPTCPRAPTLSLSIGPAQRSHTTMANKWLQKASRWGTSYISYNACLSCMLTMLYECVLNTHNLFSIAVAVKMGF